MNLRAYDSLDQPPDAPEAAKSKLVVPLAVVAQVSELFFVYTSLDIKPTHRQGNTSEVLSS